MYGVLGGAKGAGSPPCYRDITSRTPCSAIVPLNTSPGPDLVLPSSKKLDLARERGWASSVLPRGINCAQGQETNNSTNPYQCSPRACWSVAVRGLFLLAFTMACLSSTATDIREPMAKCVFCGASSEKGFNVVFEVGGPAECATQR